MSLSHLDTFEELQEKIGKVIDLYRQEKSQNEQLRKEKSELENRFDNVEEKLREIEERNKKLKIAKTLAESGEDPSDARLKLNRMVREIDKCIALLNR